MADDEPPPPRPRLGPKALSEAERRRARQAAALRENLRRRKAQDRRRDGSPEEPKAPAGGEGDRKP